MSLVPAAFLHQVADVLAGTADELRVGNLETRRDFTDVRDVAAAMWMLMNAGAEADGGVYNIASGEPVAIGDMLAECIRLGGREIPVRTDPARRKSFDVPTIVGDSGRLREITGWSARISWQDSLADMWQSMRGPAQ